MCADCCCCCSQLALLSQPETANMQTMERLLPVATTGNSELGELRFENCIKFVYSIMIAMNIVVVVVVVVIIMIVVIVIIIIIVIILLCFALHVI